MYHQYHIKLLNSALIYSRQYYYSTVTDFAKISWFIYITSFCNANVIRKQLQWNHTKHRRYNFICRRNSKHIISHGRYNFISFCNNGDHFSFSCFYFLDIAYNFCMIIIFGCNKNYRKFSSTSAMGPCFISAAG